MVGAFFLYWWASIIETTAATGIFILLLLFANVVMVGITAWWQYRRLKRHLDNNEEVTQAELDMLKKDPKGVVAELFESKKFCAVALALVVFAVVSPSPSTIKMFADKALQQSERQSQQATTKIEIADKRNIQ